MKLIQIVLQVKNNKWARVIREIDASEVQSHFIGTKDKTKIKSDNILVPYIHKSAANSSIIVSGAIWCHLEDRKKAEKLLRNFVALKTREINKVERLQILKS